VKISSLNIKLRHIRFQRIFWMDALGVVSWVKKNKNYKNCAYIYTYLHTWNFTLPTAILFARAMQIKFCEYSYGENSTRYIWSAKSIVCGDAPKGSILYPHAWILIKQEISIQNVLPTMLSSALPLVPSNHAPLYVPNCTVLHLNYLKSVYNGNSCTRIISYRIFFSLNLGLRRSSVHQTTNIACAVSTDHLCITLFVDVLVTKSSNLCSSPSSWGAV